MPHKQGLQLLQRRRRSCLSFWAQKTHLHQKTLRIRRQSLAPPPTVLPSAPQETRRTAPRAPCAHLSSASPDSVEPCPGKKPHRHSPLPARARLGCSTHRPTSRPGSAHFARTDTVGASTHFQSDKRPSQQHLDWSPKTNPSLNETANKNLRIVRNRGFVSHTSNLWEQTCDFQICTKFP